jgi:hypothetical protein
MDKPQVGCIILEFCADHMFPEYCSHSDPRFSSTRVPTYDGVASNTKDE